MNMVVESNVLCIWKFVLQCWVWIGYDAERLCFIFAWNRAYQLANLFFLLHHYEGFVHISILFLMPVDI